MSKKKRKQRFKKNPHKPAQMRSKNKKFSIDLGSSDGLAIAHELFSGRRFSEAAEICRKILLKTPTDGPALLLLGKIAGYSRNLGQAVQLIQQSMESMGENADACFHLATAYELMGKSDEAGRIYQRTVELNPDHIAAHTRLGNLLVNNCFLEASSRCYEKALAINADNYQALLGKGRVLALMTHIDEAIEVYQHAVEVAPKRWEAYSKLGVMYQSKRDFLKALEWYHKALKRNPGLDKLYVNMAAAFCGSKRFEEGLQYIDKALSLNPHEPASHANRGLVLMRLGKVEEAMEEYRESLRLKPDYKTAHHDLLLDIHYIDSITPEEIFAEHLEFGKKCADPLADQVCSFPKPPAEARQKRLRIGYVSPDFRAHSVAFFIEPVIERHNRDEFEVFCYYCAAKYDVITEKIMRYTDNWRSICNLPDAEAIKLIQQDEIDILVDLAGHTSDNHLLVFARKPAPVQVTWLGYPDTTGLKTIDYRITDRNADPEGVADRLHTEKLFRLPDGFHAFLPLPESPGIGPLPRLKNGFVTFGSFNNMAKITPMSKLLWAKMLNAVPGSKLMIKGDMLRREEATNRFLKEFDELGISRDRFILQERVPETINHLRMYNQVDIALDTCIYNGTTTTCEALWMGVPVITLAGNRHASRVGASLLMNVGLPELIATNPDDYVKIAVELAADTKRLEGLHNGLREKMKASPLTDADRFTRNLEDAYRQMWHTWCEQPPA